MCIVGQLQEVEASGRRGQAVHVVFPTESEEAADDGAKSVASVLKEKGSCQRFDRKLRDSRCAGDKEEEMRRREKIESYTSERKGKGEEEYEEKKIERRQKGEEN